MDQLLEKAKKAWMEDRANHSLACLSQMAAVGVYAMEDLNAPQDLPHAATVGCESWRKEPKKS